MSIVSMCVLVHVHENKKKENPLMKTLAKHCSIALLVSKNIYYPPISTMLSTLKTYELEERKPFVYVS